MKRAFTLFELTLVIAIAGILLAFALPRFERDGVAEATDQIVSHIGYARSLAMQDNKFKAKAADAKPSKWFKQRWSIAFNETKNVCGGNEKSWKYTVFYDIDVRTPNNFSGNLNSKLEVARDPSNEAKFMSSGWSGISKNDCERTSDRFNLGKKFGIIGVEFIGACGEKKARTLSFDEFGRPMQVVSATGGGGASRAFDRILHDKCEIILSSKRKKSVISVSPVTGFIEIKYLDL
jgi:carbamoyl-phosphate synthase large chain